MVMTSRGMSVIWNSAVALLLLTGGLLGLTLPFAKIAGGAGIPPAVWAFEFRQALEQYLRAKYFGE